MGASYLVDLIDTTQIVQTIDAVPAGSGLAYAASGAIIGDVVDLTNANSYCNLLVVGTPVFSSGQLRIQVQTSDSTTSGTFTDPTSGLAQIPPPFQSGGILFINSGGVGLGVLGAATSGQNFLSGFATGAAFQRPGQFARANMLSGDFYAGTLTALFVSQLKVTGSGGGFTYSPSSGSVNV